MDIFWRKIGQFVFLSHAAWRKKSYLLVIVVNLVIIWIICWNKPQVLNNTVTENPDPNQNVIPYHTLHLASTLVNKFKETIWQQIKCASDSNMATCICMIYWFNYISGNSIRNMQIRKEWKFEGQTWFLLWFLAYCFGTLLSYIHSEDRPW